MISVAERNPPADMASFDRHFETVLAVAAREIIMRLGSNEFVALVEQALSAIPEFVARYMHDVVVDVEPSPSREDLEAVDIDDPTELLGMYHGTPLTEREFGLDGILPDRVVIYQRNLEAMCETREEIVEQIRITVLHEVGHHFGLDEDDLEELGYD